MSAPVVAVLAVLAVAAVVLLWKVVVIAAGIGGLQWAITAHVDDAAVQVVAYALPALLIAFVISRGLPTRLGGGSVLGRGHKAVAG